jgi:fluoroacetyl-CoA thioesterase
MKETLKPGLNGEFRYLVPENKTVPYIFPEAPELQIMPRVFATGFMVALCEWACIDLLKPHLDWPNEQSVGVHVNLSHTAATPPGFTVTVRATLEKMEGRKLTFHIVAHDGVDQITEGSHERFVVEAAKFASRLASKVQAA